MVFSLVLGFSGVLCMLSLSTGLPWNDPCNIFPHRIPKTGEVETVKFTRECQKGQIAWDYPQGTLQINFVPPNSASFRLCLKSDHANFIQEIYNVVEGKRVIVQPPTEENDSCMQSHKGEIQLALVAPKTQYYMSIIPFYSSLS